MILTNRHVLLLMCQDGLHRLSLNRIAYLEARSNYTCFHFCDGSKLLLAKTLKDCVALLPAAEFYRVHHSYVVNKAHVKEVRPEVVLLANGQGIQISRRRRKETYGALQG